MDVVGESKEGDPRRAALGLDNTVLHAACYRDVLFDGRGNRRSPQIARNDS